MAGRRRVKAMAQESWSSLPADLVHRVADCLLATNDLDYYMDLRAVCRHWRSSTADNRSASNQHDPRFCPSRWIMLDEQKVASSATMKADSALLFVNTATGRFLRRTVPLLRDGDRGSGYAFVTSTTDGLLVLAARDRDDSTPTRAAPQVLNPFTGSLIRFAAPMSFTGRQVFPAEVVGPSPTLVMVSVMSTDDVYWAEPQSESFSDEPHFEYPASRLPQIAAAKIAGAVRRDRDSEANRAFDRLMSEQRCRCYVVKVTGGDLLAVLKRRRGTGVHVLKIDAVGNVIERAVANLRF